MKGGALTRRWKCPWCGETAEAPAGTAAWCRCGHRADRGRAFCDCAACEPGGARALRAALANVALGLDDYLRRGRRDDGGELSRLRDEAMLALERADL